METIVEICEDLTHDMTQGMYPDQLGILELWSLDEAKEAEAYIAQFIKDKDMPYCVRRVGVEVSVFSADLEGADDDFIDEVKRHNEPYI